MPSLPANSRMRKMPTAKTSMNVRSRARHDAWKEVEEDVEEEVSACTLLDKSHEDDGERLTADPTVSGVPAASLNPHDHRPVVKMTITQVSAIAVCRMRSCAEQNENTDALLESLTEVQLNQREIRHVGDRVGDGVLKRDQGQEQCHEVPQTIRVLVERVDEKGGDCGASLGELAEGRRWE